MLLTITTTQRPATDLSRLLQADPDDVRSRRFSFGEALIFFPQFDQSRCTAAILVQPDPDAASSSPSWLAIVLATMFDQVIRGPGKVGQHGDHTAQARPFEVQAPVLPAGEGEHRAQRLFAPLGYDIGVGADGSLWLSTTTDLASLLTQLCVLLPVLDDRPFPGGHEVVDRLLVQGDPWLIAHPEGALVARRYLGEGEAAISLTSHHGAYTARHCTRHLSA
jgi:hypothetical protein